MGFIAFRVFCFFFWFRVWDWDTGLLGFSGFSGLGFGVWSLGFRIEGVWVYMLFKVLAFRVCFVILWFRTLGF